MPKATALRIHGDGLLLAGLSISGVLVCVGSFVLFCCFLFDWHGEDELRPSLIFGIEVYGSVEGIGYQVAYIESKTQTRAIAVEFLKVFEDGLCLIWRYTYTCVSDGKLDEVSSMFGRKRYASLGSVLACVGEQIIDDLPYALIVGEDMQSGGISLLDKLSTRGEQLTHIFHALAAHIIYRRVCKLEVEGANLHVADINDIIES